MIAVSGLAFLALAAGYLLHRRLPKVAANLLILGVLPSLAIYWGYGFAVGRCSRSWSSSGRSSS